MRSSYQLVGNVVAWHALARLGQHGLGLVELSPLDKPPCDHELAKRSPFGDDSHGLSGRKKVMMSMPASIAHCVRIGMR